MAELSCGEAPWWGGIRCDAWCRGTKAPLPWQWWSNPCFLPPFALYLPLQIYPLCFWILIDASSSGWHGCHSRFGAPDGLLQSAVYSLKVRRLMAGLVWVRAGNIRGMKCVHHNLGGAAAAVTRSHKGDTWSPSTSCTVFTGPFDTVFNL